LDTASLHNQLEQAGVKGGKVGKIGTAGGEAYANGFTRALKERFKYSIANALIYGTQAAVKDMVNNVRELDKAQTELRKVTNLSGKSLEDYTNRAYKMSGAVAKTGTEIIQASTEFSKQGFGTEEALKLSKIASEFQNIADTEIDAATAAKFINSQLKAFGNTEGFKNLTSDAQKAERVIDAVNEV
jgi:TP901 family phage tail tape measure protein